MQAPDPRTQHQRLEQRIGYIDQFTLSADVPDEVRIHFETGRNLFVYAWYVYRFNMMAEQHILASLEMAARTRLASFTRNERALKMARDRHRRAEMRRMNAEGLDNCVVDYINVQPTAESVNSTGLGVLSRHCRI